MPKVSDEHLAAKQEQILQAAIRCFARSGFHTTGMAEIIRESGLSAGSVYRYYKSKDDLIAAIVERLIGGMESQLLQTTEEASTLSEAVAACLNVAMRVRSEQGELFSRLLPQMWTETLRNPAIEVLVSQRYARILTHFTALAQRMQAQGTLATHLEPQGVASVLLSLVQGYGLQKLLLGQEIADEVYVQAAAGLLD